LGSVSAWATRAISQSAAIETGGGRALVCSTGEAHPALRTVAARSTMAASGIGMVFLRK
jgi:hypothetical protein